MIEQINLFMYGAASVTVLTIGLYNMLYLRQVKHIRSRLGMFVPESIYLMIWTGIIFPAVASGFILLFFLLTAMIA